MTNLVIPTTLVADTGTGATMAPYRMNGDQAVYKEQSPSAVAAQLQLKRTEPRPTKDYAGAMKTEFKFTRTLPDSLGRQWPLVATTSYSLPAFLTSAQRTAFVLEATLASNLSDVRSAFADQVIPQA
jgi:hypothetical protein